MDDNQDKKNIQAGDNLDSVPAQKTSIYDINLPELKRKTIRNKGENLGIWGVFTDPKNSSHGVEIYKIGNEYNAILNYGDRLKFEILVKNGENYNVVDGYYNNIESGKIYTIINGMLDIQFTTSQKDSIIEIVNMGEG